VRVRLFASLREIAGGPTVEAEAGTVGELLDALGERYGPEFERVMQIGTVVVDGATVGRDHVLRPEDEVTLLPPVSGGTPWTPAWGGGPG
jgi:MoaD family protein